MKNLGSLRDRPKPVVGVFCCLGSVDSIELAARTGFDFVVVDAQHGSFDLEKMRHAIRAADACGLIAAARLPAHGAAWIEPLLDAGYGTLIAPMINSIDSARDLVRSALFPPLGLRSQSGCRASLLGGADYRQRFNAEVELLPMIEHVDAVACIDGILAVPGVAGCMIGPTDLASSMGPSVDAQSLRAVIDHVLARCAQHGKIAMVATSDGASVASLADRGFDWVVLSTDRRLLQAGMESAIVRARGKAK